MGKRVSINRASHLSEVRRQSRSRPVTLAQSADAGTPRWAVLLMCVALAAVTLVVYWQTTHFELTNVDDPDYIINNTHVRGGLTWDNFRWAFKVGNAANWHPLTWLTHMFDCQFWGMLPGQIKGTGGHHLTNFAFHIASVLLLFGLLNRLTGKFWASSLVAVVFAIHPLHAESVAWVAERKDVLSTFFMMLTLWAYASYARDASPIKYILTALLFALGLLSKQMLVTVPILLLLLDYWPLNRLAFDRNRNVGALLLEKVPLFALAIVAGILLLISQKQGGAIATTERVHALTRITNAIVTYVVYILDLFWPKNLAHYYPHEGVHWEWWQIVGSFLLLAVISVIVIRARKYPYLLVGWCWYLVTLLPVIGILQVGAQARADRYTYIPSIGICIMIAFGLADAFAIFFRTVANPVFAFTTAAVTAAMVPPAYEQVSYWHDSEKLYRHTLAVTKSNWFVHNGMGSVLNSEAELLRGQHKFEEAKAKNKEAVEQLNACLKIMPTLPAAHTSLGVAYMALGDLNGAIAEAEKSLKYKPNDSLTEGNLGAAYLQKRDLDNAIKHLRISIQLEPTRSDSHYNLALACEYRGLKDESIAEFRKVLALYPSDLAAYWASQQIATLLPNEKRAEALQLLERAAEINRRARVDANNTAANDLERLKKAS
jgi:tetratricopeptide (TPR) repeat protein